MGKTFALNVYIQWFGFFFLYRITRFYHGSHGYRKTFCEVRFTSNSGNVSVGEPNLRDFANTPSKDFKAFTPHGRLTYKVAQVEIQKSKLVTFKPLTYFRFYKKML